MAFRKTDEEKQAERVAKDAEDRRRREERARQVFLESPVGKATTAKENSEGFFEIELVIGSTSRDVMFGTKDFGSHTKKTFTGLLSEIESVGWKLEHVGYYYMIIGESSRDKLLASGQSTAVSGKTMGIYLFRNVATVGE